MNLNKLLFLFSICFLFAQQAKASHVYGTEISYRCIGGDQFIVQLEYFQDCAGIPPASQLGIQYSSVSCGWSGLATLYLQSTTDVSPVCPGGVSPCAGSGYGTYHVIYSDTITLAHCSDWVIYNSGCCSNPSIANMATFSPSFYTHATLDNTGSNCNNSVVSGGSAYPQACINQIQTYYPNAHDLDGDSLVFSLAAPLDQNGAPLAFSMGYSISNPFGPGSTASIDPTTGALTFMIANMGSYKVGMKVEEYRNGVLIATSNKDLTFLAFNCSNAAVDFSISNVVGGQLIGNVFYVEDPTQLTFDLTAIDTVDTNDTIGISSDITALGGSITFSGTNPAVGSFTWPKSAPLVQYFNIQIADSDCANPNGMLLGYAIMHVENCMPDTVSGIVAADSVFNICSDCAQLSQWALDTIYSPLATTYGSLSLNPDKNGILYHAGSNFQVNENFWVYFGVNGGQWMDSVYVDVTTVSCVWAGDADTNHIVNNWDILPLGLGFGETGDPRHLAGIDYDCEPAMNWVNSTPLTGTNYKHADCTGNGTVTMYDTIAIVQNWGMVHAKSMNSSSAANGFPLYVDSAVTLPGQTIAVPIMLGDTSIMADSIYGLAFTINYDETMTDTNSVYVDFNNSWLGTIHSDMMGIQKDFYHQGQIQVGLVRIDHNNRDGQGQIGTLHLTIKDDILKKSALERLDIQISDVRIITNAETERLASTPLTGILVDVGTSTTSIPQEEVNIRIFPNPANKMINIRSNDEIQQITMYNMAGQAVKTITETSFNTAVEVGTLHNGIYVLQIQTAHGFSTQKIQIMR